MRKILSLLLTVAMLAGCGITASAAVTLPTGVSSAKLSSTTGQAVTITYDDPAIDGEVVMTDAPVACAALNPRAKIYVKAPVAGKYSIQFTGTYNVYSRALYIYVNGTKQVDAPFSYSDLNPGTTPNLLPGYNDNTYSNVGLGAAYTITLDKGVNLIQVSWNEDLDNSNQQQVFTQLTLALEEPSAAEDMPLELVWTDIREAQNPVANPEVVVPTGVTAAKVDSLIGDKTTVTVTDGASYGGTKPYWAATEDALDLESDLVFYVDCDTPGVYSLSVRLADVYSKSMDIVVNSATVAENVKTSPEWQNTFVFHDMDYGEVLLNKGVNTIRFVGTSTRTQIGINSVSLTYTSTESNMLSVSAFVMNTTDIDITNAKLIAAIYDDEGRLFKVADTTVSVSAYETAEAGFEFVCELGGDIYESFDVKIFLWDGNDGITPLASNKETQHSSINYFTTTEIKPWLSTLHLTTDAQAQAGFKGGEGGQITYNIAVSPFNNDVILAGTDTVGVWRSTDGGHTWANSSEGLAYGRTNDIAYDAENDGVVYIINGGSTSSVNTQKTDIGIYKSTDNGESWVLDLNIMYPLYQLGGRDQLRWQTVNDVRYLYAASMGSGIWRKAVDTEGAEWECVYSGTESFMDIHTDETGLIVATCSYSETDSDGNTSTKYKLVKSTDNGASWADSPVTVDGTQIDVLSMEVSPENKNLWVCHDTRSIYKSEDAGANWSLVKTLFTSTKKSNIKGIRFSGYKASGAQYPRLFLGINQISCALRYSDDLGATNSRTVYYDTEGNKIAGESYWAEVFDTPNSSSVAYMMHKGYATSYDGGATWTSVKTQGLSGVPMTSIQFDENGMPLWISSIDSGIWKAEDTNPDGSITPTIKVHNLPRFDGTDYTGGSSSSGAVVADPNDPNHIIASTGHVGYSAETTIVQSYDGGATWDTIRDSEGNAISENRSITNVMYHTINKNVIFAGPLVSKDNGKTWSEVTKIPYETTDSETGETVTAYKTVSVMDISYSGKLLGYFHENTDHNVYISDDYGTTWEAHDTSSYSISHARFDKFDDDYVWLSKYQFLQKFNLADNTKEQKGSNMYSIRYIAQDPHDKDHLLIVKRNVSSYQIADCTIYETYDEGASWHTIEGYKNIANAGNIVFHPTEPVVYISTYLGTMVFNHEMYRDYYEAVLAQ